jgi:hypothetical protein
MADGAAPTAVRERRDDLCVDELVDVPEIATQDALLDFLRQPSASGYMRVALEAARSRGYSFDYAWAQILRAMPRDTPREQRAALHETREQWRTAYADGAATLAEILEAA